MYTYIYTHVNTDGRQRENSIKRTENWIAPGTENITGYHYSFRLRARIPVSPVEPPLADHKSRRSEWPRSRISNLMGIFHVSASPDINGDLNENTVSRAPLAGRTRDTRDWIEHALFPSPLSPMDSCLCVF